uniref:Zeamatin-like protein n=1 Tax=Zea mays subsp. parviglumis TaxID=76912 RepID=B8QXV0_ZEAMP|nr:zeamatin-like protein [Zea mays subsp. parviglumis]
MAGSVAIVGIFVALLAVAGEAAVFTVVNQCPFTVWAASVPVGGGRQLNRGESWRITAPAGTTAARIWARTGCKFDASGRGSCRTGDCGGVLQCTGYGRAPNTLAEYALKQFNNLDFFDISLIDGFNVPMSFLPDGGGSGCSRGPRCAVDVNARCPAELRQDGVCNNACPVFKKDEYCCVGSAANDCHPTNYSRYFKGQCPDAYSYPKDDATSTFTCPTGTNYKVVFCP